MIQQNVSRYRLLSTALCCVTLLSSAVTPLSAQAQPEGIHYAYTDERISGDYLSGSYHYRMNDMERAFYHFHRIGARHLRGDAGYRYLISAILTGHIKEAAAIAENGAVNSSRILPALTDMVAALKDNRWQRVRKIMKRKTADQETGGQSGAIGDYTMVPLIRAWSYIEAGEANDAFAVLDSDEAKKFFTEPFLDLQRALMSEFIDDRTATADAYAALAEHEDLPYYYTAFLGNYYERSDRPVKASALYRAYRERENRPYIFETALQRINEGHTPGRALSDEAAGVGVILLETARILAAHYMKAEAMLYARLASYISPDLTVPYVIMAEYYADTGAADIPADMLDTLKAHPDIEIDIALIRAGMLGKQQAYSEAAALLSDIAMRRPAYPRLRLAYADILRQDKQYAEAIKQYKAARKHIPAHELTWNVDFAMAICYERVKEWEAAETYLQQALSKDSNQPDVLNYLAYGWLEREIRIDEAKDMLEQALSRSPDSPHITDSLGWAYFHLKEYDKAVTLLETAAAGLPQDPVINDHLGDAYWHQDRRNEAVFQWSRALRYDEHGVYNPRDLQAKIDHGYKRIDTIAAEH